MSEAERLWVVVGEGTVGEEWVEQSGQLGQGG